MRWLAVTMLCACAARGPAVMSVSVDGRHASYRDWSGVDVCETEPTWLFDELVETNELLAHFTARGGTWRDDELPVLHEAARTLPPLLDAHARAVAAAAACPWSSAGAWPHVLEDGRKLIAAARADVEAAPKLIAFVQHRKNVERWTKEDLVPAREAAVAACKGNGVAIAWDDEVHGTTWLFCDGAEVNAPLTGGFELVRPGEGWTSDERARVFDAARNFPPGQVRRPPAR